MPWIPAPASLSAPHSSRSHQGSPPWDGGARCTGSFTPGAAALGTYLKNKYPFIYNIGGYDCRPNTANPDELSIHGTGRALDLMIRRINGAADPRGNEVADWLVKNADDIGVQLVIWDRTIWNNLRPSTYRPYTASSSHENHLHVELNEQGARGITPFFQSQSQTDWTTPLLVTAVVYWVLR